MEKYIDHRLVARPEPDNTFWHDSTPHLTMTNRLLLETWILPSKVSGIELGDIYEWRNGKVKHKVADLHLPYYCIAFVVYKYHAGKQIWSGIQDKEEKATFET